MDVEMQMNGLPIKFGEQPGSEDASHEASNIVAVASNAESLSGGAVKAMGSSEITTATQSLPTHHQTQEPHGTDVDMMSGGVESDRYSADAATRLPVNGHPIDASVNDSNSSFTHLPSSNQSHTTLPTTNESQNLSTSFLPISHDSSMPSQSVLQSSLDSNSLQPAHLPEETQELLPTSQQPVSGPDASSQLEPENSTAGDISQPHLGIAHSDATSLERAAQRTTAHPDTSTTSRLLSTFDQPLQASTEISHADPAEADQKMGMSFTENVPEVNELNLPPPPTEEPPSAPRPAAAVLPSEESKESQPLVDAVIPPPGLASATAAEQPTQSSADVAMTDDTSQPVKNAREREDDEEDSEHLAKRAKTDNEAEQTEFKVPEVRTNDNASARTNGDHVTGSGTTAKEDDQVTPARLAHMKKIIANLKKSTSSVHFRQPVDVVALKIPQYYDIIKQPMDLSAIDKKLKGNEYSTVNDFVVDFELIVNNSITFNGPEHAVSQQAVKMQNSFNNQMQNMPKSGVVEQSREEKKALKVKTEPVRQAPPRRPSMTASAAGQPGSARSPVSASQSQTFAVGPEGVPLIRRDSNMADGRPKRAIVPTKRNIDFGTGRPKKKKYELQLRFCQETINDLMSSKNWQINQWFIDEVDPVALNIPTYFQIIKKPMALKTVAEKLAGGAYEKAKDFEEDVRQIFKNCFKFNPEGDAVNLMGHKLEEYFNNKWEQKDDWIAAREPTSEPQSPGDDEDDDDDDEDEDEEEDDSEADREEKLKQLQKQIEAMSKQMGELTSKKAKKATPPTATKKGTKTKKEKKDRHSTSSALADSSSKKAKDKKKPKAKAEKERFVTYAEKQYISNGISHLPDKAMLDALKIIQQNVPHLRDTAETEIELDIDELPNSVLLMLLNFVKKYAGPPPSEAKEEKTYSAVVPGKPKKNKPMNKADQEAQIKELQGKLGAYDAPSPDAHPSIEKAEDDSDDDDDEEEESEEE